MAIGNNCINYANYYCKYNKWNSSRIRNIYFSIFSPLGLAKKKIIRILNTLNQTFMEQTNWDIDLMVESQTLVKGFGSAPFEPALSHKYI